jgi:hypothetical protein
MGLAPWMCRHFQTCPRPAAVDLCKENARRATACVSGGVLNLVHCSTKFSTKVSRSTKYLVHVCVRILNLVCEYILGHEEITEIGTLRFR